MTLFCYNIIDNKWFEYGMIALAFAVGTFSLFHGRKKHHHSWLPMVLFSIGIVLLLSKVIWHHWQLWLLIPAVIFIVASHYLNYRMCRSHNHAHSDDCNH